MIGHIDVNYECGNASANWAQKNLCESKVVFTLGGVKILSKKKEKKIKS